MTKIYNLHNARKWKNDEFYTQYEDVEREMESYIEYDHDVFRDKVILCPCDNPQKSNFTKYFINNFKRLGIKKLISTCYLGKSEQTSVFDQNFNGKVFTLCRDTQKWQLLNLFGNGDFRSEEITRFRDEADYIITNPPFSLFREFISWIMAADKQFSIIGSQNAITYKDIFPLIKENRMWLGNGFRGNVGFFSSEYQDNAKASEHKDGLIRVSGVMWFTNIDHGKRHRPINLMTMDENLKSNKQLINKCRLENWLDGGGNPIYPRYTYYDAIEVPFSNAIPSDYSGMMGVPITFLDRYCPEQFEIVNGVSRHAYIQTDEMNPRGTYGTDVNGKRMYFRIMIKQKENNDA